MSLATRSGVDSAGGGTITGPSHVIVGGAPWAVAGASVASHGDSPHNSATIPSGASHVTINGLRALVAGDGATCGHTASGSGHVDVS